jgi:S-adenosylmethionine:tRNA ribosyltransferase-isomerase
MKRTDFSFELPPELIAQHPSDSREKARLLAIRRHSGITGHHTVSELPRLLSELFPDGVVMVFNDSRVRKARLYATTSAGDREIEFLLVKDLSFASGETSGRVWQAMSNRTRRLKPGTALLFAGKTSAEVRSVENGLVTVEFAAPLTEAYFSQHGHVPLPPYIDRDDAPDDEERYQTVYANEPGSVAAPTAGLHFTKELLAELREAGVQMEWVRLHVGMGTFLPVRVEQLEDHTMHEEECELTSDVAGRVMEARALGKTILAVGTTTVRTLESAWDRQTETLVPFRGATDLFITPGYEFGAVDAMFTNFHTPESTLLMLVSAFAGHQTMLSAYREAVENRYRFFSYGDATLLY